MKTKFLFFILIVVGNLFAGVPSYVPSNGLVAWWPFNGTANDESGNGNHGAPYSVTLSSDRFNNPESCYLWNSNPNYDSRISLGNLSDNFVNDHQITISAWIYQDGGGYNPRIISWGESGIYRIGTSNYYSYYFDIVGSGKTVECDISSNQWHQIVYTSCPSDGGRVYIDSKLIESIPYGIPNINYNHYNWEIGRKSLPAYDVWGGKIDDVGIWKRALTPDEVYGLFTGEQFPIERVDSIALVATNKSVVAGRNFEISINTSELKQSDSINSYQFEMQYDTISTDFIGVDQAFTLSKSGNFQVNNSEKGVLKIGWISTDYLQGEGKLLNLNFSAKQKGNPQFTVSKFFLNSDTVKFISNTEVSVFNKYGDANGDDLIVAHDAGIVLQYSVGIDPIPSKDPLPWEHWRQVAADVDGNDTINAYDASLILQRSIDLINQFPVENASYGAQLFPAFKSSSDITIDREWDELVFRSYGEVVGFNLDVENGFEYLSEPTTVSSEFMVARNISQDHYKVGMASSSKIKDSSILMVIPIKTNIPEDVTFKILVNSTPKTVTMRIATGIDEHVLGHVALIPNPVKDYISIKGVDNGVLKIYDLNGRLLIDKEFINTNKIDVQFIENGVYFYRINTDQGVKTGKFIKL